MPTDFQRTKWNLFVWNNLNKAKRSNDVIAINYWNGLFV